RSLTGPRASTSAPPLGPLAMAALTLASQDEPACESAVGTFAGDPQSPPASEMCVPSRLRRHFPPARVLTLTPSTLSAFRLMTTGAPAGIKNGAAVEGKLAILTGPRTVMPPVSFHPGSA